MKHTNAQSGLTMIELLISVIILALFSVAVFKVYSSAQKMISVGLLQTKAVADARTAVGWLGKAIRPCKAAVASGGGNTLTLTEDVNHNPDSASNITKSVYYTNGDGSDLTYNDNKLMYDPNTAVSGDLIVIASNVVKRGWTPVFSVNGSNITVIFSVKYTSPVISTQSAEVSTVVRMRN